MARQAVRLRRDKGAGAAALPKRAAWVAGAGLWLFAVVSLAGYNAADWPSTVVAVHNHPMRNPCGLAGATTAWWGFHVLGIGAWVVLAGTGAWLVLVAAGRRVGHPLVRGLGLLLAAVAVSSLDGLIAPRGAAPGGLLAFAVAGELGGRFGEVGTFLVLLAGLALGALVAADRAIFAALGLVPATAARVGGGFRLLRWPKLTLWSRRSKRKAAADADEEEEDEEEDEEEEEEEQEEAEKPAARSREPRRKLSRQELAAKLSKLPVRLSSDRKVAARDEDIPRQEDFEGYQFPGLDLLEDPESNYSQKMDALVRKQAQQLEEALSTYGIGGEVVSIESGPTVTLYSVQLEPGTKVSKVTAVASDVARALRAHNVRIVSNMVGKTCVGIEVPNIYKERVRLKELMTGGHAEGMALPMFLGKDAAGEPLVADLARLPHMLIAGTTGSGKSVCMNSIIMSWLYTKRPDELKLILVDPKMVELGNFQDIPHLMCPVVTETSKAAAILEWGEQRMEERYELLREAGVRNLEAYNKLEDKELFERFKAESEEERSRIPRKLPHVIFIIDELADLIMQHPEVERAIVRIAQKARAVGIHLMFATQRPQANVVTGLIKANMPCRVSFKVASGMDSRIVLDQKGAELLLGQGDMLFMTPHTTEVKRAQGTLVTDQEIRKVTKFLRGVASPTFERSLLTIRPSAEEGDGSVPSERDPLFDEAVRTMIETGRGSVSLIQRRLGIGYSRASRLVDQMALAGILGDHKGSVAREVMITLEEWEQMKSMEEAAESAGTIFDPGKDGRERKRSQDHDGPVIETTRRAS